MKNSPEPCNTASRKRSIVIDDEQEIRDLLKNILDKMGYETETYSDPLSCPLYNENNTISISESDCVDVLITDFNMPGMNGIEFILYLKEKNYRIRKLAIMSGTWDNKAKMTAEHLNCKIFEKPFLPDEIINWIED